MCIERMSGCGRKSTECPELEECLVYLSLPQAADFASRNISSQCAHCTEAGCSLFLTFQCYKEKINTKRKKTCE